MCFKSKVEAAEKPYLYGFLFILFIIFFPLLIWFIYFIGDNGFILINTSLKVGDALVFYGSLLTFSGTVGLGVLALWQNIRIGNMARDANNISQQCNAPMKILSTSIKLQADFDLNGKANSLCGP